MWHYTFLSTICTPLRANKRETIDWLKFTLDGVGEEPWLCPHNQRFSPMLDLVLHCSADFGCHRQRHQSLCAI